MVEWLCQQVLTEQRQEDTLMASVNTRWKAGRIEPPTPDRVRRLVHTAIHRFDERLCTSIMQRLSAETRTHLDALLTVAIPALEEQQETMSTQQSAPAEQETEAVPLEPALSRPQSALHALKEDTGPVGRGIAT